MNIWWTFVHLSKHSVTHWFKVYGTPYISMLTFYGNVCFQMNWLYTSSSASSHSHISPVPATSVMAAEPGYFAHLTNLRSGDHSSSASASIHRWVSSRPRPCPSSFWYTKTLKCKHRKGCCHPPHTLFWAVTTRHSSWTEWEELFTATNRPLITWSTENFLIKLIIVLVDY